MFRLIGHSVKAKLISKLQLEENTRIQHKACFLPGRTRWLKLRAGALTELPRPERCASPPRAASATRRAARRREQIEPSLLRSILGLRLLHSSMVLGLPYLRASDRLLAGTDYSNSARLWKKTENVQPFLQVTYRNQAMLSVAHFIEVGSRSEIEFSGLRETEVALTKIAFTLLRVVRDLHTDDCNAKMRF